MTPSNLVLAAIGPAIMAHAGTFAPAEDENKVVLLKGAFTPSNDAVVGSLEQVTTNGLSAINLVAGSQLDSRDALTGDIFVEMKLPLGGLRFETTSAPTDPIDVTGFAVLNAAGDAIIGLERFPAAIRLSAANQSLTIPKIVMRIPVAGIA